ncbi:hypothetical protein BDV18DRAFT_133998 [Aspergillus unguis]
MSHSNHSINTTQHGNGVPLHFHVPDSDGAIILMLGAVVFVTFALGLVSQLCEMTIFPFPRRRSSHAWDITEEDSESNHQMAELDLEAAHYDHSPLLSRPSSSRPQSKDLMPVRPKLVSRPTTRYGSIMQHEVTVNGARKLVLVVDDQESRAEGSPDGYTAWLERWRTQHDRIIDERAPMLESQSLLDFEVAVEDPVEDEGPLE